MLSKLTFMYISKWRGTFKKKIVSLIPFYHMSTKTSAKYIIYKTYKIRIAVSNCGRNNKLFWYFLIRQKIILFSEKTLLLYTRILLWILGKVQGISTQVFMVYIATEMKIHFMIVLIIRKSQIHFLATNLTWESHAVSGQRETHRQAEAEFINNTKYIV